LVGLAGLAGCKEEPPPQPAARTAPRTPRGERIRTPEQEARARAAEQRRLERQRRLEEVAEARRRAGLLRENRTGVRRTGRGMSGGVGRAAPADVVSAIIAGNDGNYALIGSSRVEAGDVVMGRRIVDIGSDYVTIEAFGRRSRIRVGGSIMSSEAGTRR